MTAYLVISIVTCMATALFFRNQLSFAIVSPSIALALYFVAASQIFNIAEIIPVFHFNYGSMDDYYLSLIVIISYSYGTLLGFSAPAKVSGISFLPSKIFSYQIDGFREKLNVKRGLPLDCFLLMFSIIPVVIILVFTGFSELISRDRYPMGSISKFAMGTADTLFWLSLISIALISRKWMQWTALILIVSAFSAAGARQAFVALIVFVMLDRLLLGRRRISHIFIVIFAMWLLSALIFLRYDWSGGLLNVMLALFQFKDGVFDFLVLSINYMSIFSVVSITTSIQEFGADAGAFLYAINPLPSSLARGEDQFLAVSSVQPNVPYAAVAMMYNNLGIVGVFMIGFIVGLFAFFVFLVRRKTGMISVLFLISFLLIPFLFGLQYNMRAYSRLLYFTGFTLASYQLFFSRIRIGQRK